MRVIRRYLFLWLYDIEMNHNKIITMMGIQFSPTSHTEKILSGVGAFLAIYAIYQISSLLLGNDAVLLVASMGAAAVLLFSVPHGALSQPWPLFAGNLISACVGVVCALYIPDIFIAAAAAVGIAIIMMHYLHCVHPPAGATAILAVIGGDAIHGLGFSYVMTPILLNVLVLFLVAFVFNYGFKWRRYPASLIKVSEAKAKQEKSEMLSHQGIEYALKQIDSFVDVSEQDIQRIYQLAREFDEQ